MSCTSSCVVWVEDFVDVNDNGILIQPIVAVTWYMVDNVQSVPVQNSKFKKSGKAGADESRDITEKKYKMLVKLFWVYFESCD